MNKEDPSTPCIEKAPLPRPKLIVFVKRKQDCCFWVPVTSPTLVNFCANNNFDMTYIFMDKASDVHKKEDLKHGDLWAAYKMEGGEVAHLVDLSIMYRTKYGNDKEVWKSNQEGYHPFLCCCGKVVSQFEEVNMKEMRAQMEKADFEQGTAPVSVRKMYRNE